MAYTPPSPPVVLSVGAVTAGDGTQIPPRGDRLGATVVTELEGRYYEQASRKNLFWCHAIVTAPVIYTTAAGTGGPLLWNGSNNLNVALLAVGFGVTTVATVAAALGITGAGGQTVAPTSTTAIDSSTNAFIGGPSSVSKVYRVGTPAVVGSFFIPFAALHTGALTVDTEGVQWVDLGGSIVVPPMSWASVAASATASTTVVSVSLLYAEIPF